MEPVLEEQIRGHLRGENFGAAAAAAIRGYGPEILGYLTSVMRDADDADDAFSRFAEDLWKSLRVFRSDCSVRAWCYKLAWHAAVQVLREPYRKRRRPIGTSEVEKLVESVRATPPPHLRSVAQSWIEKVRAQLAPDEQTLLVLRFDRRLSWHEVTQVLSSDDQPVDEAALRKRYERLKTRLRKAAHDAGIVDK